MTIVDYLQKFVRYLLEEINMTSPTPASDHFLNVCPNDEQKLLDEERAEAFHHGVAQLLFAMPWARNNIQTAVAFLTTRVQAPDQDDWRKLRRLLQYLRGVIQMPLILRADSLNVIKWWVDASNAMHGDMRGHTGAEMLLRCGSVISMSKKKKNQYVELDESRYISRG